jgi:hypothetical protein
LKIALPSSLVFSAIGSAACPFPYSEMPEHGSVIQNPTIAMVDLPSQETERLDDAIHVARHHLGASPRIDPLQATLPAFYRQHPDIRIDWSSRSLHAFEFTPVEELAHNFDLVILDHPFAADIAERRCLRPLDELLETGSAGSLLADRSQHIAMRTGTGRCRRRRASLRGG